MDVNLDLIEKGIRKYLRKNGIRMYLLNFELKKKCMNNIIWVGLGHLSSQTKIDA